MAEYRVICVVRGSNGDLQAVGYSRAGNRVMYDDRWTLEQVRRAIEGGHRLYTVSPSTGQQADLELFDGGLRVKQGQGTDNDLDSLPDCG